MPYHVLTADRTDPSKFRALFTDLDRRGVRTQFLKPFLEGRDILWQGKVHRTADIAAVQIRETESPAAEELQILQRESRDRIDRLNREGGIVIVSVGHGHSVDDLVYAGQDVTPQFLTEPPGSANQRWFRNPWVVTIVGGLIVATLAATLL